MSGDQQLWDDADLFSGDPLSPDYEQVCPPSVVASLTAPERRLRVTKLVAQAHHIVDKAWELADGRMRAGWCVLYSGGNDSTVLTHMFRTRADHAVHCNTTIGIEATRQFVRDTCAMWGLDLIERVAPVSYAELVLGRWNGFPGPAMHAKAYQRLKERQLDQVRSELVNNPRAERVLFIAGRRRAESRRRTNIPLYEVDGSAIWASPLAMWTKLDMNTYRLMQSEAGDVVPVNVVSEKLHMSGECLCGAFAKPGELDEIRYWYPEVADEIENLERIAVANGIPEPFCRWGHGQGGKASTVGKLCTSCDAQYTLFDDGIAV